MISFSFRSYVRFLCVAIIPAALAGCGASGNEARADANAPVVPVVKVERKNLDSQLSIASEFQPFQDVFVYAKVSGYIQKLYVDWGTHVKRGQLLAVLEIPELQQQIQQDEASVRRSEQNLLRAQEELTRSQSAYRVAHLTYSRLADVQKSRPELVAQEEIDVAQGKDLEANANVSAAKDSQAAGIEELSASKAALEKDRALFAYARITAPFDGVITEMDAYTGALLPAGTSSNKGDQALCHLSQNNLLRLVIPVPERVVSTIQDGQSVDVRVSGLDKEFNGKIVRFSDNIDPQTRTMHTEVDVENPQYQIVPGMYATIVLPLQTARNVLTLPIQAVRISGETQGHVMLLGPGNKLQDRDVTIGTQGATLVEIASGLNDNDKVVFGEQNQYRAGQLVKPRQITPQGME
jgi:RND family efflux transporter MFP subunit